MYLCGPGKHNCQPFCGPEGRFYCSDSVCSLWPAPFSYLCVSVMILCVCWKLSAAEQVKTDCCHTPAVVSTLLTPLPVSCPLTTPLHYNFGAARAGWAELPETTAGWVTTAHTAADNPDDDGQPPTPPTPGTTTDDPASHQHHRRPRLATNTTDVAVPQLTTPASHQHHRRPRLATITTDDPG